VPPNVTIAPEPPDSPEASALIAGLEEELVPLYAAKSRHGYSVARLLAERIAFFVARADGAPAGCGGLKIVPGKYAEIKRMYVRPEYRGRGVGVALLSHLTAQAQAARVPVIRLETGIHQHEAIGLYEREGFRRIPPFAEYTDDPVSRCYEKSLG
jgi:ribosomal protein S18 acetylase RimI-like enzyme